MTNNNLAKPNTFKCLCKSVRIIEFISKLFSIIIIYASKERTETPETSL